MPPHRILVIRPDRIGDVVLSTPVFTSIRRAKPDWEITALVKPMVAGLLEGHPDVDRIIPLEVNEKPSMSNTRSLARKLREIKFNTAVHLYSDFWVSLAVWRAGIPVRIGPASKIAKVFYNRVVVQRRSKSSRHEADHNLGLLEPLGIAPVRRSSLPVSDPPAGKAGELLDENKKNIGVFPGMGGSARNWHPGKYAQLINEMAKNGSNVILMGGPEDKKAVKAVTDLTSARPQVYLSETLPELAAFIRALDCFVAPSTGPLHIATAVGTPAIGIYCPIRVCLPQRWGPIGEKDKALVPNVPVCEKCLEEGCSHYDCMDRLGVRHVTDAVRERI